ncbi:hypothetical protein SAMN05660350_04681 [Geodermatophilus obscurus]|uniref:Uncharacterized protein n=1 Tax=Geodermatophilus obscurus TaxID=1861 RepID=A0A1M7V0J1_9ACTN|nr:hypothetical protein SAMN05660350_04681 [Geodermatophilus obscurus]
MHSGTGQAPSTGSDGTPSEPVLAARFDDLPDYVDDGAPG